MTTILFFDDFCLSRWNNVVRRIGSPIPVPEATFKSPQFWLSSAFPTVFRTEEHSWRMMFQGRSVESPQEIYALVADSEDGIHWTLPDLATRQPHFQRRFPNQVLPTDRFGQWDCFWDERAADPEQRIKGLVTSLHQIGPTELWTSPDGLKWKKQENVEWRLGSPDPPSTIFWNEVRQSYVLSARPASAHPRRYALSETKDWRTFSQPELALMTDAQDPPLAELYGMIVFPYEEKFVAFLWIYHTDATSAFKYWGGEDGLPVGVQLQRMAFSKMSSSAAFAV